MTSINLTVAPSEIQARTSATADRTVDTDFVALNNAELARTRMKRLRTRVFDGLGFIVMGVVLIGGWEWGVRSGLINPRIAPSPSEIVAHMPVLLSADYFLNSLTITLQELGIGFGLGIFLGVSLGVLVSLSEFCRAVVQPYVVALHAPPKVLLAPLFVTLFGFGMASKIVMAVIIAFFPLFVNTVTGLSALNGDAERLMKSMSASSSQVFFKVRLPNAMPLMAAGVKLCWTLAVTGVIVAEFIGAQAGLGFLVSNFNFQGDILGVFCVIVLIAFATVVVYWLLEFLERKIVFWERI